MNLELLRTKFSVGVSIFIVVALAAALYICSLYNYLLFHSFAEIFSIIIAVSIFLVAWNTRKYIHNQYLLFIGIAYLSVAALDLLHTFTYSGMRLFAGYHDATQLWIAARYLESLSFLAGFLFISKRSKLNASLTLLGYILLLFMVTASIFVWKIFPECYVQGQGQTSFKIISEYVIILALGVNLYFLRPYKSRFNRKVYKFIVASLILTMLSEFFFTFYIGVYDLANLIGHYLKILSFYYVYKAILETGLSQPVAFFFRELKQSEEALKNLNATKDKIFSILAHDLKNPFNSLIGFSQLLLNNQHMISPEEQRKLIQMINISARKANNLLENLLQWSRTQTGSLISNPEHFDVTQLIDANIALHSASAEEKNIMLKNLQVDPLTIYADKNMISAVLRNLINNAIKFTRNGGSVMVHIRENEDRLEFVVTDTGIGIPKEELDLLFTLDKYHSTMGTAQEKGSGLGLIICKEFVEKNGGRIIAQSQVGKGSEFTISLPKAAIIDVAPFPVNENKPVETPVKM